MKKNKILILFLICIFMTSCNKKTELNYYGFFVGGERVYTAKVKGNKISVYWKDTYRGGGSFTFKEKNIESKIRNAFKNEEKHKENPENFSVNDAYEELTINIDDETYVMNIIGISYLPQFSNDVHFLVDLSNKIKYRIENGVFK